MKKALVSLVVCLASIGTAVAAPQGAAVTALVRGVVAEVRHRDPNSPPYEAIELGGVRLIANTHTAKIVGRKPVMGAAGDRGMVGSWAVVKVIPLDVQRHDLAEGDQRLMHRQQGAWRMVAVTDEGNGFRRTELRRAHVPAFVVRDLHLEVQEAR